MESDDKSLEVCWEVEIIVAAMDSAANNLEEIVQMCILRLVLNAAAVVEMVSIGVG